MSSESKPIPITDLIGKWIIRSEPVIFENGVQDTGYTDVPIKLIEIKKDGSIIFQVEFIDILYDMPSVWNDGHWIEYSIDIILNKYKIK